MDTKKQTTVRIQPKKTPLIKSTSSFDIYIPQDVEAKIRHLCSVVHDVEWSGTLFYKYSGSIEGGDFKVTCVDLFVMDIGTSAYTEFKESPDVINYRALNDLLDEDIYEGLIHSHNTMSTFFSGTDQDTLIEEGTNTNHFVSLIVNNAGSYTAAVTRKLVTESKIEATIKTTETKYYNTYNDERVVLSEGEAKEETKEETKTSNVIEYYELKIIKDIVPYSFRDIDDRLSEIKKSKTRFVSNSYYSSQNKKEPNKGIIQTPSYPSYPSYNSGRGYYDPYLDNYDDWDDYRDAHTFGTPKVNNPTTGGSGSVFPATKMEKEEKEEKKEEEVEGITNFPLCLQESFDAEMVKHLSLQLLTSCIMINDTAVNPADWVKKMDGIYEKRFGPLDKEAHPSIDNQVLIDNNARLEGWIENMVEFLVYTRDEDLISRLNTIGLAYGSEYDESDTAEVCAYDMYNYIEALPESYVKDVMLKILNGYIPDGVENYK